MAAMLPRNNVQNIRFSGTLLECAGFSFEEIRPIADAMEQGGPQSRGPAVNDRPRKSVPYCGTPHNASPIGNTGAAARISCWTLGQDDPVKRFFGEKVYAAIRKKISAPAPRGAV